LSALDWRTFSVHLTNVLGSRFLNPVDDDNCACLNLRYTALLFRILRLQLV
jgi:hypothetical protein